LAVTRSHEVNNGGSEGWSISNSTHFSLVNCLEPGKRPVPMTRPGTKAKDDGFPVAVEDGPRGGLKGTTDL
jgi:hypothetical protein